MVFSFVTVCHYINISFQRLRFEFKFLNIFLLKFNVNMSTLIHWAILISQYCLKEKALVQNPLVGFSLVGISPMEFGPMRFDPNEFRD